MISSHFTAQPWHLWIWAAIKSWKVIAALGWSLVVAWRYRDRLRRSNGWPMVWGEVYSALPMPEHPRTLEVTYNYGAGGSFYAGTYHKLFLRRSKAAEFSSQLLGQKVEVFYNLHKPQESVMKLPHWFGKGSA